MSSKTVRAKFTVVAMTQRAGDTWSIELSPVVNGSEENKQFFKWTPSGKIELGTLNLEAAKQFKVGHEYYIDFTSAE